MLPSYYRVVQQKVNNADIENAIVIIPTLADVVPHNDLGEGIPGERKRLILCKRLFLRTKCIGRLNINLLAAGMGNKVDLPCHLSRSAILELLPVT